MHYYQDMMTTTTQTTFTKLRSGAWGIKGLDLVTGQTVAISKRDGTSKTVTVGAVLGTHKGATYAQIAQAQAPRSPRRRNHSSRYYGSDDLCSNNHQCECPRCES